MIHRIVKMTFKPNEVDNFIDLFENTKDKILNREGCCSLKLIKDINSSILFTYSIWETDQHLNDYRNSELFEDTWSKTKILFSEKPEAWSTNQLYSLIKQ